MELIRDNCQHKVVNDRYCCECGYQIYFPCGIPSCSEVFNDCNSKNNHLEATHNVCLHKSVEDGIYCDQCRTKIVVQCSDCNPYYNSVFVSVLGTGVNRGFTTMGLLAAHVMEEHERCLHRYLGPERPPTRTRLPEYPCLVCGKDVIQCDSCELRSISTCFGRDTQLMRLHYKDQRDHCKHYNRLLRNEMRGTCGRCGTTGLYGCRYCPLAFKGYNRRDLHIQDVHNKCMHMNCDDRGICQRCGETLSSVCICGSGFNSDKEWYDHAIGRSSDARNWVDTCLFAYISSGFQ